MRVRDVFNSRVISLERDADFSVTGELRQEVLLGSAIRRYVIVSLESCEYCDVAMLRTVLGLRRWLESRLQVVIPKEHVARRTAGLLGWTDALELRETLSDALLHCAANG